MLSHPERGLPSAHRLGELASGAGHLVHMPSHIYLRVGDYAAAAKANEKAIAVDRAYIQKFNVQGIYPMMYYSHNMHFVAVAEAMQGRFKAATKAADDLVAHVGHHVKDMPMLEGFMPTPTLILVRFGRWDDILALPAPPEKQLISRAIHHFARGLAQDAKASIDDAPCRARLRFSRSAASACCPTYLIGPVHAHRGHAEPEWAPSR